jgi:hypothetical protein
MNNSAEKNIAIHCYSHHFLKHIFAISQKDDDRSGYFAGYQEE